jgi:hypothetical protein
MGNTSPHCAAIPNGGVPNILDGFEEERVVLAYEV